eukprot:27387-Chlamydomonas_euryale.AAC.7
MSNRRDQYDFCEQHPDIVILVTSILSTETVLAKLPLASLKRSTCIVDVLSVKVFPKQLLLAKLPEHFDIVCTHPMFGVNSGGASWKGLNFQYEVVRVNKDARDGDTRMARVQQFLKFFADEQCNMVDMTCEDHDFLSASSQFITHTVGRTLGTMHLQPTPIDTKGYQALLELVRQTNTDSFDLYYGLFLYNQNATDELERLERGLERVKKSLLSKLHDIAREEMFPASMIKKSNEPLKLVEGLATSNLAAQASHTRQAVTGLVDVQQDIIKSCYTCGGSGRVVHARRGALEVALSV